MNQNQLCHKSDSKINNEKNKAKAGSSKESQMKRTNSKSETKIKNSEDSFVQNHDRENTSELNSLKESVELNQCEINYQKVITDQSEESPVQKRQSKRIKEAKKKAQHSLCMPIKESSENVQQPEKLKRLNSNPELKCDHLKRG